MMEKQELTKLHLFPSATVEGIPACLNVSPSIRKTFRKTFEQEILKNELTKKVYPCYTVNKYIMKEVNGNGSRRDMSSLQNL